MSDKIRWYRQGEILIQSTPEQSKDAFDNHVKHHGLRVKEQRNVVREGELTGHYHRLTDQTTLYEDGQGNMFFRVDGDKPAIMTHDEHDPIKFPKGNYKIIIQREYDELGYRYIAD